MFTIARVFCDCDPETEEANAESVLKWFDLGYGYSDNPEDKLVPVALIPCSIAKGGEHA